MPANAPFWKNGPPPADVIGLAQAVHLLATAERLPDEEFEQHVDMACRARFPEQQAFPREKLLPPSPLRLYRAHVTEHSVHIPGREPVHGKGIDSRLVVDLR